MIILLNSYIFDESELQVSRKGSLKLTPLPFVIVLRWFLRKFCLYLLRLETGELVTL